MDLPDYQIHGSFLVPQSLAQFQAHIKLLVEFCLHNVKTDNKMENTEQNRVGLLLPPGS